MNNPQTHACFLTGPRSDRRIQPMNSCTVPWIKRSALHSELKSPPSAMRFSRKGLWSVSSSRRSRLTGGRWPEGETQLVGAPLSRSGRTSLHQESISAFFRLVCILSTYHRRNINERSSYIVAPTIKKQAMAICRAFYNIFETPS